MDELNMKQVEELFDKYYQGIEHYKRIDNMLQLYNDDLRITAVIFIVQGNIYVADLECETLFTYYTLAELEDTLHERA